MEIMTFRDFALFHKSKKKTNKKEEIKKEKRKEEKQENAGANNRIPAFMLVNDKSKYMILRTSM